MAREMIAELIERYGALQNAAEMEHLISFLSRVDDPHGYTLAAPMSLIIEIGVWRGGNAAILKTFFPDVRYIGVDSLPNGPTDDGPSLTAAVERFGLEIVEGDTHDPGIVARVQGMIGDRKADYIFIDASHDYDSVKRDFELWSPLGKTVGFHDVHNPSVWRFWLELVQVEAGGPRTYALWKETDGLGIGVVFV